MTIATAAHEEQWREIIGKILEPPFVAEYAAAFVKHHIVPEEANVEELSEQRLRELGIRIGHRDSINKLFVNLSRDTKKATEVEVGGSALASSVTESLAPGELRNKAGARWFSLHGTRSSLDVLLTEVREVLGKINIDQEGAMRCFAEGSAMPFHDSLHALDHECSGALCLRTPDLTVVNAPEEGQQASGRIEGHSVGTISNRFILLYRIDTVNNRAVFVTYSKNELPTVQTLRDEFPEMTVLIPRMFYLILKAVMGSFGTALETLSTVADDLETNTKKYPFAVAVERLSLLQKQARVYKRLCGLNGEVLQDLASTERYVGSSCQFVCDRCTTFENAADEMAENALNTLNMMMALDNFRGGANTKLFTYIGCIQLPLCTLSGWYGMNWKVMPELQDPNGYWICLAFGLAIIVAVVTFLIVKNKMS